MQQSQRISSFELGRVLAIIAVLIIHTGWLSSIIDGNPWPGHIANQLSRFAVPYFFLLAGYFLQPRLASAPIETARRYTMPLMKIWLGWSVIYMLVPFRWLVVVEQGYLAERMLHWGTLFTPPLKTLNTLFEGGMVHLWFLPGLACAVWIIALLWRHYPLLLVLAIALFIYGVLAGSYRELTGLPSPIFTRNGPFFSTLMVLLGIQLRRLDWRCSTTMASIMLLAGLAIHLLEAWYLETQGIPFQMNDYLLGTPLWAVGLFGLLLANPAWGRGSAWLKLCPWIPGIYVAHLIWVLILIFTLYLPLGWMGWVKDLTILPLGIGLSIVTLKVAEKTPVKAWLVR